MVDLTRSSVRAGSRVASTMHSSNSLHSYNQEKVFLNGKKLIFLIDDLINETSVFHPHLILMKVSKWNTIYAHMIPLMIKDARPKKVLK